MLKFLCSADYWTIRLHDIKDCMLPSNTTENELESCDIFISTCKPLGNTICPNFPNSTTCQKVVTTTGESYYYDMGTYSSKLEFEPLNGIQVARYNCDNYIHWVTAKKVTGMYIMYFKLIQSLVRNMQLSELILGCWIIPRVATIQIPYQIMVVGDSYVSTVVLANYLGILV